MSGTTHEKFEWESDPATESETSELLSTGIEVLDRKLGGGVPKGTIIALSALPASQSELFLYEMAAVRETVYLTTACHWRTSRFTGSRNMSPVSSGPPPLRGSRGSPWLSSIR